MSPNLFDKNKKFDLKIIEYQIAKRICIIVTRNGIYLPSKRHKCYTIIHFYNTLSRFLYGFINYLKTNKTFRENILRFFSNKSKYIQFLIENSFKFEITNESISYDRYKLTIIVHDLCQYEVIIRTWSSIVLYWTHKKYFYEAAWAYLSTLGGAYSSLGEDLYKFAKNAEIISLKQLKLAIDFNDPIAIIRCKLFLVFSQIQLHKFSAADRILKSEQANVEKYRKLDCRIGNMYIAAGKKLKFEKSRWKKLILNF